MPNPKPETHNPKLSIILPALNEAAALPGTLARVRAVAPQAEVIVADGGSSDATRAVAAEAGAHVLNAPRGRARQMNAGAAHATGDVFLFLHADTLLPDATPAHVRATLADADGGCFRLAFDADGPLYRFYSWCTRLRWPGMVFGDRALFCTATAFRTIGGYPEVPIFEDVEFVRRLARHGRFAFRPEHVTTAARRFETHGPARQQLRNVGLFTLYTLGFPPHRLARFYRYVAGG